MDLMSLFLLDKQIRLEKPDIIIRPEIGAVGIVDQVDISKLVKLGESAAVEALPDIHKANRWQNRMRRKISAYLQTQRSDGYGS